MAKDESAGSKPIIKSVSMEPAVLTNGGGVTFAIDVSSDASIHMVVYSFHGPNGTIYSVSFRQA